MEPNSNKPRGKQPIMHALGQSIGILWKAIREPVKKNEEEEPPRRQVVDKEVKQIKQGPITLRETTIREVEIAPGNRNNDNEDENSES